MLMLDWPSPPSSVVSLAERFSSTSRYAIKLSTDTSYLLCFRAVAKFLYDEGNFAIMHLSTNLLGKGHLLEDELVAR